MSIRDILEVSQSVALANQVFPTEIAIYEKFCREYSKKFSTELTKVYELSFEFVATQLYAEKFNNLDIEESQDELRDLIGSLENENYDIEKERALRAEDEKILEQERIRIANNMPIHESLVKKTFGQKPVENKKETPTQPLPLSGGINMDLIKQLQNEESESGF